ncbi:MAG: hypothetical protein DRG87_04395, partial [Deltaproteobacteria bacterium]
LIGCVKGNGGQVKKILKHLGLWELKARPQPKAIEKTQEYLPDDSTSQLPISGLMLTPSIRRFTRRAAPLNFSHWEPSSREAYNLFSSNCILFTKIWPQIHLPRP